MTEEVGEMIRMRIMSTHQCEIETKSAINYSVYIHPHCRSLGGRYSSSFLSISSFSFESLPAASLKQS